MSRRSRTVYESLYVSLGRLRIHSKAKNRVQQSNSTTQLLIIAKKEKRNTFGNDK